MIDPAKIGQVESGIPMPDRRKYPFAKMNIGDSFLIVCNGDRASVLHAVTTAARRYVNTSRGEQKFNCRTERDGVRIWRTA